jgi:dTDP-4-amino-4,6-dideoxygalactose transaminase
MQASILDLKLQFIKTWIKKRQYYARLYNKKILNKKKINKEHVYHLYVLRTQRRNKIINYLKTKNINVGIHYENPVHKMNPYKKYFHNKYDNLLNSEKISREVFSLPLHPFIKKNEVEKIIAEIKLFNNKNKNEIQSTDKI